MSNFLRREADSFFFRRRVPAQFQSRIGCREIYRSLNTVMRRTAKARAAHMFIATESLFQMLEEDEDYILTEEDIRAAVRHWLDNPMWRTALRRQVDNLTPGDLRAYNGRLPDTLLESFRDPQVPEWENLAREATAALESAGYEGQALGKTLRDTEAMLKRQLREYVDRRMQSVFGQEVTPATTLGTASMPTPLPENMAKLSTFIKPWQKDIVAGYNHNKPVKDADQYLKTVEMFIGLMGDLPVGRLTFDTAAEFRELILQLPATHGKGATGTPKKELARARADKSIPRVSMKTAKRHFSGMNSIWKWLIHNKHVPASPIPFSGHSFPGTKSKKSARDDWSSEDMQRLFTSREYRDAPEASALHWLPLIALYSGMRLEEIARLRPGIDIVVRDRTHCFHIATREGWDPKTEAGTRIIPIHSWLVKHGLMDFVNAQKVRGAQYLFSPELVLHNGSLSSGFSREFSRLKIDLGVGTKTTFHSFRHTFRTVLESTNLKESHIDAVMGHEGGGSEGRTYSKRVTTAKLREVVETFHPPLALDFLGASSAAAPPPARSKAIKKKKLVPPKFDENGKLIRNSRRG